MTIIDLTNGTEPSKLLLTVEIEKIRCEEENDPGDAEEIFGNIYVIVNNQKFELWKRKEDEAVDVGEKSNYPINNHIDIFGVELNDMVIFGGH